MLLQKGIGLICSFIICTSGLFAQPYFSKTYDLNYSNDLISDIVIQDTFIYIAAHTICQNGSSQCAGLLKINFEGNLVWKDVVDSLRIANSKNILVDSQNIFIALYKSGELSEANIRLLRLDHDGLVNAYSRFGWELENERCGDMIFVGDTILMTVDDFGTNKVHLAYFNKNLDSLGLIEYYNGSSNLIGTFGLGTDSEGDLVHTRQFATPTQAAIRKTDFSGNFFWENVLESPDDGISQLGQAVLKDNGIAIHWRVNWLDSLWSPDTFIYADVVYKFNSDGDSLWGYRFFDEDEREINALIETSNGELVGCGNIFDFDENGNYFYHSWIFRMDPNGNLLWKREVIDERFPSGQFLFDVAEMPNGDLLFGGQVGAPGPPTGQDLWLLRTNSEGCWTTNCIDSLTITAVNEPPEWELTQPRFVVYPSPFSSTMYLEKAKGLTLPSGNYSVQLINVIGQIIYTDKFEPSEECNFQADKWPVGLYYIHIYKDGLPFESLKAIKGR
jgi:hypothetical protein